MSADAPDGLLLVDKPTGPTSFDVIRRLRRATGVRKFGHAGTLDPMASGLLPVLVNRGTRLVPYLMADRKRYLAEATLGAATNTDDAEGDIIATGSLEGIDADAIAAALGRFVGAIDQVPPQFSAIKVNGQRAYARARAGDQVELASRTVEVHAIELVEVALPQVRFAVDCGKGTYIRSLARDLGQALGCLGHLSSLRRTRIGAFDVAQAVTLEALEAAGEHALERHLVTLFDALAGATRLTIDAARADDLAHGRTRFLDDVAPGLYRVAHPESGELLAIVERTTAASRPGVKVFA